MVHVMTGLYPIIFWNWAQNMGFMGGLEISWAYYGLRRHYVNLNSSVGPAHNLGRDNNSIRA